MLKRYEGTWWLPSNPSAVCAGTLTLSERNSATLLLKGTFAARIEIAFRRITADVIYGTLDDGHPVTLIDCYHDVVNGLGQEYFLHYAFLGVHLTTATALQEVRFTGSELDNFLSASAGLNVDKRELGVRVETMFRGLRLAFSMDRSDEAALVDEQPRSRMTLFDVPDWATAWKAIGALSLFLTLAAGEENATMNVEVVTAETSAQVVASMRTTAQARAADRSREWMMWTLDDIPELGSALARFDELYQLMRHSFEFFVAYIREPGDIAPASSRIAQTLESYHRDRKNADGSNRYRQQKMAVETFNAIRASFTQLLADRFPEQKSMVGQLRNDPSMRERLTELASEHEQLLDEIRDKKTLVADATKNRNVFSHGANATLTSSGVEDIFWAGMRQRFLFYAILLVELGFPRDDAHRLLRRNRTFERLALLSRERALMVPTT